MSCFAFIYLLLLFLCLFKFSFSLFPFFSVGLRSSQVCSSTSFNFRSFFLLFCAFSSIYSSKIHRIGQTLYLLCHHHHHHHHHHQQTYRQSVNCVDCIEAITNVQYGLLGKEEGEEKKTEVINGSIGFIQLNPAYTISIQP